MAQPGRATESNDVEPCNPGKKAVGWEFKSPQRLYIILNSFDLVVKKLISFALLLALWSLMKHFALAKNK